MKSKISGLFALSIFSLVLVMGLMSAINLASWDLTSVGTATTENANVTAGTFTASIALTTNAFDANGSNAENWPTGANLADSTKYFEVTISPKTGYNITISDIGFDYVGSAVRPDSFDLQYSTVGSFDSPTNLTTKNDVSNVAVASSLNSSLNIQLVSGETLTLRWFGYKFTGSTNEFFVSNLLIQGSTVRVPTFCRNWAIDEAGLDFEVEISNMGEGDDDDWQYLDTIEIEITLDNDKTDVDLEDVVFEIGLFEKGSSKNIADDLIWISDDDEEFEFGDIDEGDRGKHTFEFRIDPNEFDSDDYILMVKAYPDGDESKICIDSSSDLGTSEFGITSTYYAEIEISEETDRDKMVVVDDLFFPLPIEASCSEKVVLDASVWNIGSRDFEDQVLVSLFNSELGLDLKETYFGDLDTGDNIKVPFTFEVPSDAEEKTYSLKLMIYYQYDEAKGTYETDYDRVSDDTFEAFLRISGNCVSVTENSASVSATLESEAKAGESLVVLVTITNTDDTTLTYDLNAAGYAGWATSVQLSQTSFTLNAGDSKVITFTFGVKEEAVGEKTFNVEVFSGGEFIVAQQVSVLIEEAPVGFLRGITGNVIGEGKGYLWAIGFVNLVLIILVIVVAVRLSRKE